MSASTLSVGTILAGRYVLASHAAASNAPEAWCASMAGNEQPVMVLYYPGGRYQARALQRIVTEGSDLLDVRHPRVGALLDLAGEPQGGVYGVTPWYGDDTLARRLERQGVFNLHVAGALIEDVLAALAVLHSRRLSHRAVSPRDVTLFIAEDGRLRARLIPGGQLAELGREGDLREHVVPMPDPIAGEYASPEQWAGGDATAESDVWAVGVMLHRLAAGVMPFEGDDAARLAAARGGTVRISDALPPAVAEVLRRALDPRPGGRYTDADAMRIALETALADSSPLGAAAPSRSVPPRPTARPPAAQNTDDFDLDDLVADLSRKSSKVPPPRVSAPPTLMDHSMGAPMTDRPPLSRSLAPPAQPPPPTPSQRPISGFDLDHLGPPPSGKVASPPVATGGGIAPPRAPAVVESTIPWRDSQVHTALEAKSIDRTHVKRPTRPRGMSVAAAMALVVPVTVGFAYLGWRSMQSPTTAPRVEPVRALEAEPMHPMRVVADGAVAGPDAAGSSAWTPLSESQSPVEFGEQFHIAIPAGLDGPATQAFVSHVTTSASLSATHPRGFASCVAGRVFLHRGGVTAPLVEAIAPARCESQDIVLVSDLDGDGASDAVAVDRPRSALLIVGSRRASVLRRISLPGAWGLAGPVTVPVRGRPEPAVVAFVSTESGVPTLMAVGLQSGRVAWRLPASLRPAEPRDFGLAVIGDLDADGVDDVAMGLLRDGQRCVMLLSGATGTPRWDGAYCLSGSATQTVTAGPDLDGDDAPDLLVSSAADGRLRMVSGRTGREITAVTAQGPEPTTGFGAGALYTPDLARDGYPDIGVVRATTPDATLEVYSANDGHRLGSFPLHGAVGAVVEASHVRVQFARDFLYPGSVSLMVASPVGVFVIGAAPRPEGV